MTGGEFLRADVKDIKAESVENYKNIKPEKEMSAKDLNDAVKTEFDKAAKEAETQDATDNSEKKGLSDADRIKIKEETSWSDGIIDRIENMDQYEIYKKADLHEEEINGRKSNYHKNSNESPLLGVTSSWRQQGIFQGF